ncbi:hypothetical protein [Nostoc sp. NZL]|uniref:hypothetical protein n=1 Tax=Nostoc sp. NZL TaxID=2650612 RepID=UPI001E5E2063|nr:hypothetical protein [Nostoc sp. NZL]
MAKPRPPLWRQSPSTKDGGSGYPGFIQNGAKLGWLLDFVDESIMIFEPNKLPELKEKQDILPVLSVLENWQLTVADVFRWLSFI